MTEAKTVYLMLEECSRAMSGAFSRQEILSWFSRHYPDVKPQTISAHIQACTSNSLNREQNHPGLAGRTPLFDRVAHGVYRVHVPGGESEPQQVSPAPPVANPQPASRPAGAHEEWHWEGQVQARVVAYLAGQGVSITRVADTASKEHGTDIEGSHHGVKIHVEVKGWPSAHYADPARAHEQKKTAPVLQARVWFADGLMQVLRLRHAHPSDSVALALPDMPTYQRLFDSVRQPVEDVHISIYWVSQDGAVTMDGWGRDL